METNNLDYFRQKIYEISKVPKSYLEESVGKTPHLYSDSAICKYLVRIILTRMSVKVDYDNRGDLIQDLEKELEKWISVKDRLPDEGECYDCGECPGC